MQSTIQTATSNYRLKRPDEADNSTAMNRSLEESGLPERVPGVTTVGCLNEWLLAATLTASVSYFQPQWDLFRSSMYPAVVIGIVQRKKRLSLRAARQMALGVLADTERRLWKERADEANFLISFVDVKDHDL